MHCAKAVSHRNDYIVKMNAVANYVAANLDQEHSVERLAQIAHLSKYHFHRLHHAITGETLNKMVSRLRLEAAAATLFYQPRRPITQVALDPTLPIFS